MTRFCMLFASALALSACGLSVQRSAVPAHPGELEFLGQSTVIDFSSGVMELIREGAGDPSIFNL